MKVSGKTITLAGIALSVFAAGGLAHSLFSQNDMVRAVRPAKHNKQHAERACREFAKTAQPGATKVVFGKKSEPHDLCVVNPEGATVVRMRYAENDTSKNLIVAGRATLP